MEVNWREKWACACAWFVGVLVGEVRGGKVRWLRWVGLRQLRQLGWGGGRKGGEGGIKRVNGGWSWYEGWYEELESLFFFFFFFFVLVDLVLWIAQIALSFLWK